MATVVITDPTRPTAWQAVTTGHTFEVPLSPAPRGGAPCGARPGSTWAGREPHLALAAEACLLQAGPDALDPPGMLGVAVGAATGTLVLQHERVIHKTCGGQSKVPQGWPRTSLQRMYRAPGSLLPPRAPGHTVGPMERGDARLGSQGAVACAHLQEARVGSNSMACPAQGPAWDGLSDPRFQRTKAGTLPLVTAWQQSHTWESTQVPTASPRGHRQEGK